jgi:MoaA/NifB/PqqE/SkfB family radical SAM enzyme
MSTSALPASVVWDVTYACPLRCGHCYSSSGRRPARQLSHMDMLRVTDAIIATGASWITIAGGEPLIVPGILEVIERLARGGLQVALYTGGWSVTEAMVEGIVSTVTRVSVSVDGPTAEIHDRIRGRAGSFDRAMTALGRFDAAAARRAERGEKSVPFGIDVTVTRTAFDALGEFCAGVAARFPRLGHIWFQVALPIGLANRPGFAEHELLTNAQLDRLASSEQFAMLRELAPPSVQIETSDNPLPAGKPDPIWHWAPPFMQVEPDGEVRAIPIYEGTVGNILDEAPEVIWARAAQRWRDPFIVEALAGADTMVEWAAAARRIDERFASASVRRMLDRRPRYQPAGSAVPVG